MADTNVPVATPKSIADVEQLIKELYKPNSPTVLSKINHELLQLQLSPDGWQMADQLMACDDDNVRFFAGLTFDIKLSNDGPSLNAETNRAVQQKLLYWLVRLVRQGEKALVCKKLCSALTTYFLKAPSLWRNPLLHLAVSLKDGDIIDSSAAIAPTIDMVSTIASFGERELRALLWFSESLADEVGKISVRSQVNAVYHTEMDSTALHACALIKTALVQPAREIRAEALQAFLSWVHYVQPVWQNQNEAIEPLRSLIGPASACLRDDIMFVDALDLFRDILDSYMTFFQTAQMDFLAQIIVDRIRPRLDEYLASNDHSSALPLVQFVVAFGCANIQQVIEDPRNALTSSVVIHTLMAILHNEGIPGDDDELSIHTIEFWNTYIEYVNEGLPTSDTDNPEQPWIGEAKRALTQAVELLFRKLWIPPPDIAATWSDQERESFKEFRLDCTDLMLSIFVFLGRDMLAIFVTNALQSLQARLWEGVEAALFCLNTLSDNVLEESSNEEVIEDIFRSNLLVQISNFEQPIPTQTRRAAIDMLGSYGQYIERHPEFLGDTVRLLFASLEVPVLANTAAKSIDSLCSTCRAELTTELPGFLSQYQRFLESPTNEPYTKQKVIGAIASIIQALQPESAKAEPLVALLTNIEKDVDEAKSYAAAGNTEMAQNLGVSALECLACVGKGLQVPDDVIDLSQEDELRSDQSNFWESDDGQVVQHRIMSCFSVLQVVGQYSDAVDAACQVLRSGFTETEPGPFVMPPSVTIDFLNQCSITTPQVESVLSTACMLIPSSSHKQSKLSSPDAKALYHAVAAFAATLGTPSTDPAIAAGCIEIWTKMMPHFTHILLESISESILDFTLSGLEGFATFPKRQACDFWTKMVKPQSAHISLEIQSRINEVNAVYGPKLVLVLTFQIGGQAQRSDLDFLCEPLKALFLHQGQMRNWLVQALEDPRFPAQHVDANARSRFLSQFMAARGDGRFMKEVVRTFWASCKGTVASYR